MAARQQQGRQPQQQRRLFDNFLWFRLEEEYSAEGKLRAAVTAVAEHSSDAEGDGDSGGGGGGGGGVSAKSVGMFCFPDAESLVRAPGGVGKGHVFSLQDSEGVRQLGFCRRFLPPSPQEGGRRVLPECLCLISHMDYGWKGNMNEVLHVLELILYPFSEASAPAPLSDPLGRLPTVVEVLQLLLRQGVPAPNHILRVPLPPSVKSLKSNSAEGVLRLAAPPSTLARFPAVRLPFLHST